MDKIITWLSDLESSKKLTNKYLAVFAFGTVMFYGVLVMMLMVISMLTVIGLPTDVLLSAIKYFNGFIYMSYGLVLIPTIITLYIQDCKDGESCNIFKDINYNRMDINFWLSVAILILIVAMVLASLLGMPILLFIDGKNEIFPIFINYITQALFTAIIGIFILLITSSFTNTNTKNEIIEVEIEKRPNKPF